MERGARFVFFHHSVLDSIASGGPVLLPLPFQLDPDALFICSKMYYKCSFHVNEGIMKSLNGTTEKPRILLMKVLSWHI